MKPQPLPTGTVTFLFTDIEGSTELLTKLGTEPFDEVLVDHGRILREALCTAGGGREVRVEGDSFFVAFSSAPAAVAAATAAQRALAGHTFRDGAVIRVRMGMHTGEGRPAAAEAGADYVGIDVHRAARIAAAAHGGQVVISDSTRALVHDALPSGVAIRDLGEHQLKDFAGAQRIHQLVIDGLPADFPALRTLDRARHNLPAQLTTFVGREREVAEGVRQLSDGARLLTLTGPGGTGKTRLSIEIASDLLDRFADGVFWVPLGPISDPGLVGAAIASSLGIHDAGGRPVADRVAEHLRDRAALLVLDNFEQLLTAAPIVGDLLRAAPKLRVIVSSRAPLHVYGEQEFPVPPLSLPETDAGPEALSQSEAVRLFVERAMAIRPDFQVTAANARPVAEIVRRLDGLPLAIELAAARIKILPPETILQRLAHALDTLSGGARDLPDRQRTLRGAIAWSHDLLDAPLRRLFERLAVFAGGAWLEQIEAVCGPDLGIDVLDGLSALVDQSLLRQRDIEGAPRFVMLVTIREFALERLAAGGEESDTRRRHAAAYLALAQFHAPQLTGPKQRQCLDELERDHDNIRTATEWAIANDPRTALRSVQALWRFWHMRGHLQEAEPIVRRVLALEAGDDALRDRLGALEGAGGVAYWAGDVDLTKERYEEALALAERLGDAAQVAEQNYNVSFVYQVDASDPSRARMHIDRGLERFREIGDTAGIAKALWVKASLLGFLGDLDGAAAALEEATRTFRERDDRFGLGWALYEASLIGLRRDDPDAAERAADEATRIFDAAGDLSGITILLTNHAIVAWLRQDPERAVRLWSAAEHLRDLGGGGLIDRFQEASWWAALIDPIKAAGATHQAARDEGRVMDKTQAVAYALERSPAKD